MATNVGRSRGGLTTKIHAVVDGKGLPIRLALSAGQQHDSIAATDLLDGLASDCLFLADRAYDSDQLDQELRKAGVEMISPHRQNRKKRKTQDGRRLRRYERRWLVERFFKWLR